MSIYTALHGPGLNQLKANKANNSSTPNLRTWDTESLLSSPAGSVRSVVSHSNKQGVSHSDSQIDSMVLDDWNPFQGSHKELNSMEWETASRGLHSTFPSPPLSPKLRPYKSERLTYTPPPHQLSPGIICVPNWTRGQTIKNYRHNTRSFLSGYKLFNSGDNNLPVMNNSKDYYYNLPRQSRYLRNDNYNDGLRKSVLKHHHGNYPGRSKSPYLPQRHQHQHQHHRVGIASSPPPNIASVGLVTEAPQYIPMVSWQKLPDYSPPISTLANFPNNKCLKVEWKGSPLNLSHDPLRAHLHPAELVLASILRLPCDLYLDSKRRLFLEKVCKLQNGLPFRRTDAQKACRIDVNKASRLYSAFERVGWLNDSNFIKHLK